tara:strand:+ start:843 stop:2021 length:1179 start_codon:yes stop_codon:yes gene_type:complete
MSLTYKDLIGNSLVAHTKRTLTNGETLTFYIDQTVGAYTINRYPVIQHGTLESDSIQIFNVAHDSSTKNFIRNSFEKLDKILDLDFVEMSNNNGSMIDIYHVNYSSSFNQSNIIGQALSQRSEAGSWWDIFWKDSLLAGEINQNSDENTIIHEIGHTLGLVHPFNDPENELFDSDDTIMSYNRSPSGWNNWFTRNDLNALLSIWGREDDLGIIDFDGKSSQYKFRRDSKESYFVDTEIGLEEISTVNTLRFSDQSFDVQKDIIEVFDLIVSKDHITGKIYRLYNAAFGRFPDQTGLNYWIKQNKAGIDSYRTIAKSFIISNEFLNLYGTNPSNSEYVTELYSNILGRVGEFEGFNYWLNQINQGFEDKSELLMGFSESLENKAIFSQETNFF